MNRSRLRFLLLHLSFLFPLAHAGVGDILWRDDFDGTSLNTNYWSYDLGGGGWGNSELQTYTTGAVSVSGGLLNIRAERISTGFTSGRIKTDGKVLFKYGIIEARIKTPDVDAGLWPAFWTLGENFKTVGWPRSGEIDIMEIGQGLAITEGVVNRRVVSGAHWEFQDNLAAYALWKTFNVDLNQDFHIYKLEWTPTSLTTYVDGVRVWQMDIDASNCVDCEEFQQPHFMLLNLAVGGSFTSVGTSGSSSAAASSSSSNCSSSASSSSSNCGPPRIDVSAPLPANMQVDWVQIVDNGFSQIFPTSAPTSNPTKAPTKRPTPNPTHRVVAPRSTKSPTRRPTSNPTPNPTPQPTRNPTPNPTPQPTRNPTPNPTPRPTPRLTRQGPLPTPNPTYRPFQPVGYYGKGYGKGGKGGKGGKSNYYNGKGAYYNYENEGKGGNYQYNYGKGGKGSKKSSSSSDYDYYSWGKGGKGKGSKRMASYTTFSSALVTEKSTSGVSQDATVHQSQAVMAMIFLALMFMA